MFLLDTNVLNTKFTHFSRFQHGKIAFYAGKNLHLPDLQVHIIAFIIFFPYKHFAVSSAYLNQSQRSDFSILAALEVFEKYQRHVVQVSTVSRVGASVH